MDPVDPLEPLSGGPPTSTSFRIARVLPPGRFAVPLPAQARPPAAASRRGRAVAVDPVRAGRDPRRRSATAATRSCAPSSTPTTAARRSSSSCARGRRATTRRCTRCSTPRRSARTRRSPSSPTTGARTARRRSRRSPIGRIGPLRGDGTVRVPVTVTTDDFGKLKGTLTFKASETEDGVTRVAWAREQRLPGLRKGEEVRRRSGAAPDPRQHLRRRRQAAELRRRSAPRSPAWRARSRPASSASTTTAWAARAVRRCASATA